MECSLHHHQQHHGQLAVLDHHLQLLLGQEHLHLQDEKNAQNMDSQLQDESYSIEGGSQILFIISIPPFKQFIAPVTHINTLRFCPVFSDITTMFQLLSRTILQAYSQFKSSPCLRRIPNRRVCLSGQVY